MEESLSERRMAENEVLFRQHNEQIPEKLEKLKQEAEAEGDESLMPDVDMPLHFYCECSNENCRERIVLKPSEYQALHQNTSQFVLLPGHNVAKVERTVKSTDKYIIVEKYIVPPETPDSFKTTEANNLAEG